MTDVPFNSLSNIQIAIVEFRKEFKTKPPVKRGRASTPQGEPYNYYLSEDLLDYVINFLEKRKLYLDTETFITVSGGTGIRFTIVDYEPTEGYRRKSVEMSIGNPASVAELGARITYAQKYLISVLFGVSITTDTDAFNNGKINQNERTDNSTIPGDSTATPASGSSAERDAVPSGNTDNTPVRGADNSSPEPVVGVPVAETIPTEHTRSYGLAKTFIEKALSNDMLDQAVTKINNSANMRDDEKVELLELVATRRDEVSV